MQLSNPDPHTEALACADRAIAALTQSLDGKPDETSIETDVRSLRGLASVVDELRGGLRRCGGSECFGHGEGGFRAWVRSELLARETARAAAAQERARELEAALARVVEAVTLPQDQDDIFWDWRGAAAYARSVGGAALLNRHAPVAPSPAG